MPGCPGYEKHGRYDTDYCNVRSCSCVCHVFADQARTKGMSRHPGVGPGVPLDRPDLREPLN